MSQNRPPSAFLVELQNQYIAVQIDLEQLSAALDAEYQPAPGFDPFVRYAPAAGPQGESANQYEPYLHFDESSVALTCRNGSFTKSGWFSATIGPIKVFK